MTVHFVGAGPGAADLITVRAKRLLEECPVCLYAGSLVPAEVLAHCPPGATLTDTADLTLDEIVAAMGKRKIAGSRSAVWRFFDRRNISFKKNSVRCGAEARGRGARAPALDARARPV